MYKKNYYVNSHEGPSTVRYHWKFIDQYIEMGTRVYRWIQIEKSEKIELSITFPILSLGGYDVDTIPELQKILADNFFSVNLSVTAGVGV